MPRKGDSLTGGTGDVNPQWMKIYAPQPSADATVTLQVPLPVQRLPQKSGKALVMELLKVRWDPPVLYPNASAVAVTFGSFSFLTTRAPTGISAPATTGQMAALTAAGTTLDFVVNGQYYIVGSVGPPFGPEGIAPVSDHVRRHRCERHWSN